ncbi:MAG: HigA family addiction module antitoxin [Legionellales bacterium]
MTTMHNPPHPGQFIKDTYLDPLNISTREVAENLGVSPSTLNRLIKGKSNISPTMAFRLAKTLGRTPESWLAMQAQYDLWITKRNINLKNVHKLKMILREKMPLSASGASAAGA